MKDDSLISLIVPVYGVERVLPRCIESLMAQTYRAIEIILVDDGSPDGSAQICDEYAKKDGRIRVIHKENGFVPSARNAGLDIAKGEYIAFVDGDDFVMSDMYEHLLSLIEAHDADIACCDRFALPDGVNPDADVSTEAVDVFDHHDGLVSFMMNYSVNKKMPQGISFSQEHQLNVSLLVWDKLFRRSVFDDLRFDLDIKVADDTMYTARAMARAKRTVVSSKSLYCYVYYPSSVAHTTSFDKLRCHLNMPPRYKDVILQSDPELKDIIWNAYAFIYVAILNRLLGFSGLDNPEARDLFEAICTRLTEIKSDSAYKAVEPRLKAAITLALRFPFANRIVGKLFRMRRQRQYGKFLNN